MDRMHGFTLVVEGVPELTEEVANQLFEAGCDDALPLWRDGIVSVGFDRTAPSLREAITSAIRDIERAGIGARVIRIEDVTSDAESAATLERVVGSLNSALHTTAVVAMAPTLQPSLLDRLGIGNPLWGGHTQSGHRGSGLGVPKVKFLPASKPSIQRGSALPATLSSLGTGATE